MLSKIYLEITNVCNLACSFCIGTKRKAHFLSEDEFTFLATRIRPYSEYLYFHIMGEPLLHPLLSRFLEIAGELGFKVIITTNGTLLDKCEFLLSSPELHKINISLHSFEANDKSENEFEKYIDNCARFADVASKNSKITVFRLWNDGGSNKLNERIISKLSCAFPEKWQTNTRGMRIRDKLFIENGEKFDWPLTTDTVNDKVYCYGLKDQVGVLCDGSVVPCCLDYDGNMILGNLFDTELGEILNNEYTLNFRKSLDNLKPPHKMCRHCGFARNKFKI